MSFIDRAEVNGSLIGLEGTDKIFQFSINVDHTVTGQASGSSDVSANTAKSWGDFEFPNPRIIVIQTEATFSVGFKGTGLYASTYTAIVDGLLVKEMASTQAAAGLSITSLDTSNLTTSTARLSWWMAG